MGADQDRAARVIAFHAMEREHELFAYRVDGWSAWRIMRFPVHQFVLALPLSHPERSLIIRISEALLATVRLLRLVVVGRRQELLLKTRRTALRLRKGTQYRDLYFDALLERGHSGLKLEEVNSPNFSEQAAAAWRPPDLDPVAITFWGRVLGWLFPVDATAFCNLVSERLRQDVRTPVSPRVLLMLLSTVYWQSRIYGLLLSRVRPKAVLIAETGDYSLRIAANRQQIPVIELQHGVLDADHPDAIPLWAQGTITELVLPDVLACYGEFWIDQLADTHQGRGSAIAVGNQLIDLARQRIRDRVPGAALHIVLTSQGLDTARLLLWLEQMIASAPSSIDWRMSIKLHPVNDANTRDFDVLTADDRIKVICGASDPNAYDLLADADLHLSIISACHFDAAALGVPTVIIPLAGHEPLLKFVDEEHFFLASHPSRVWNVPVRKQADLQYAYRFSAHGFVDNLQSLVCRVERTNRL